MRSCCPMMMKMWGLSLVAAAAARGETMAEGRACWVAGVAVDSRVVGPDRPAELEVEEPALNLQHTQSVYTSVYHMIYVSVNSNNKSNPLIKLSHSIGKLSDSIWQ